MPVYVVDKPLGLTSHDVVARVRKRLGTRKVGHAGTLDPLASGVLVVLVDEATKLSPFLTDSDKRYLAWIGFGATTATLDAEGPITDQANAGRLRGAEVEAALPPFLELDEQLPPAFSAIKQGGVTGYRAARQGAPLELPPRPAGYRELTLLAFARDWAELPTHFAAAEAGRWQPDPQGRELPLPDALASLPTALVAASVRAGTYLRAFARDLGTALGLPAHLSGLVRTAAGGLGLERATALETFAEAGGLSARDALPFPQVDLSEEQAGRVRLGQRPSLRAEGRVGLIDPAGALVAVAEVREGRTRLLRVWP